MRLITKIFLLFLLIINGSSFLSAQDANKTIRGIITDDENGPLAYVNVYILGSFDGAMSDDEGKFTFNTTQSGEIELVASLISFEKFQQPIELDTLSNNPLHLTLKNKLMN